MNDDPMKAYQTANELNDIADKLIALADEIDSIGNVGMAEARYDKALAIACMKLDNGVEMELDGIKIQSPKAACMKEIAKGMCWKAKFDWLEAKAKETALNKKIDILKNAGCLKQSANKKFDVVSFGT